MYPLVLLVVVQRRFTNRFLGEGNDWFANPTDAKYFPSGADAFAHCLGHQLEGFQFVICLYLDDPTR